MYYSYHNVIRKKIKEEKVVDVKYVENYKSMGKVIIIRFEDGKEYPIREYAWYKYKDLI